MPIDARCPKCKTGLQIPDKLGGRQVRCSNCQTIFAAPLSTPPPVPPSAASAAPPQASSAPQSAQPAPPPGQKPEVEAEEERPRPRKRKRRRNKKAHLSQMDVHGMVQIPGTIISIVGIINVVLWVLHLLVIITYVLGDSTEAHPMMQTGDATTQLMIQAVMGLVSCVYSAVLVSASNYLKCLQNYPFAFAGCVMAMLPCYSCCIIGLPAGVWGLIILLKPEVREAFR